MNMGCLPFNRLGLGALEMRYEALALQRATSFTWLAKVEVVTLPSPGDGHVRPRSLLAVLQMAV
jgi:hypothetical protein